VGSHANASARPLSEIWLTAIWKIDGPLGVDKRLSLTCQLQTVSIDAWFSIKQPFHARAMNWSDGYVNP